MSIEIDLSKKVVLITGASQGIGAEMAQLFHRAGATVAVNHPDLGTSRHDAETLMNQLNALRPQSACAVAADVADAAAVQAMMQELKRSFGGIDFLINNAAILRDRCLAKMSLDEWNAVIGVNPATDTAESTAERDSISSPARSNASTSSPAAVQWRIRSVPS